MWLESPFKCHGKTGVKRITTAAGTAHVHRVGWNMKPLAGLAVVIRTLRTQSENATTYTPLQEKLGGSLQVIAPGQGVCLFDGGKEIVGMGEHLRYRLHFGRGTGKHVHRCDCAT